MSAETKQSAETSIEIDKLTLQIVFDCAVGSSDFYSGYLMDEDVTALRAVAVLLDVDPMEATPRNFKCKYDGKHEPYGDKFPLNPNMCSRCHKIV